VRVWTRVLFAALAVGAAGSLVWFLGPGRGPGNYQPLILLAVASLCWFLRPRAMLWLAVLVPIGPVLDFPFLTPDRAIYATEVLLLVMLVGWAARRARSGVGPGDSRPAPGWPVILVGGYALVGLVALVAGHPETAGTPAGLRALRILVLGFAVCALFSAGGRGVGWRGLLVRRWTGAALVGLGVIALGGIVEFVLAVGDGGGRPEPGSFYRSSVAVGVHVAFLSPLALSCWLAPIGRRWRLLGGIAWLAGFACLPLTASRGATASVLVTSTVLVLLTARRWPKARRRSVWLVLVVLAVGLAGLAARPEIAGESFAYKFRATVAGDFFSTRADAWAEALTAIAAEPLAGEDPGAWAPSLPLELARRHGVPAALLLLAALVAAMSQAIRAGRAGADPFQGAVALGLGMGLAGLLLVGLAETGLGARTTPLVASAVGLTCALAGARATSEESSC